MAAGCAASRSLRSTPHPNEYRSLAEPVRAHDRVLQATPNALTKSTVATLGMLSTASGQAAAHDDRGRDGREDESPIYKIATIGGTVLNKFFRSNIRSASMPSRS